MVVIKRSVRASSVPVSKIAVSSSDFALPYFADTNVATAQRISSAAMDDTDALMTASKRHDQQLLSDINTRLANASFNQPITVKRSMTTTYSSSQSKDKPPLPTGRPQVPLRRYLVLDHDDDEELIRMPATPVTTSVIRSSSVPPRLPTLPHRNGLSGTSRRHVTRIDSHVLPPEVYQQHGVPIYGKVVSGIHDAHSTNHPSFSLSSSAYASTDVPVTVSLTPVADLAIRQAHRNLDRIDKEMKFTYDHPNGPHKFSSKTYVADVQPVVARRTSARVPSRYSASTVVRTASVSPSRTSFQYHHAPSPSPSDLLLIRNVSPAPPSLPARVHTAVHTAALPSDLQMKVDLLKTSTMEVEPPLLTNVYKKRIDRALPYTAYVTPGSAYVTTDVITTPVLPHRGSAYVDVITTPVLPPRGSAHVTADVITTPVLPHRGSAYVDVITTPVLPPRGSAHVTADVITTPVLSPRGKEPIEFAPVPKPISVRPKLSETRRKVREVLCKVRNDPHYFD